MTKPSQDAERAKKERTPFDGEPYYCADCGAGLAEFYSCEWPTCKLETHETAKARAAAPSPPASPKDALVDLRALFDDHYWDSLTDHKHLIMAHIDAVLALAKPPASPPAVEELAELLSFRAGAQRDAREEYYYQAGDADLDERAASLLQSLSAQIETLKDDKEVFRYAAIDSAGVAAHEIRLRTTAEARATAAEAEREKLRAERDCMGTALAAAWQMRDELRGALRKIADHDYTDADATLTEQPTFIWQTVARSALGETKGGGK